MLPGGNGAVDANNKTQKQFTQTVTATTITTTITTTTTNRQPVVDLRFCEEEAMQAGKASPSSLFLFFLFSRPVSFPFPALPV